MRSIKFLLGTIIFSFIFLGINSFSVLACSPVPPQPDYTPPSIEDHANNANWIMIGTVIGGIEDLGVITEAEVEVVRYLKGEGEAIVHIQGFGHSTACLTSVEVGDTYIFFTNSNIGNTFDAFYYELREPITPATENNIEQIFAVTNHSVAPSPMPIAMQIERAFSSGLLWNVLLIVLGVSILTWGLFEYRSNKPKKKVKRS